MHRILLIINAVLLVFLIACSKDKSNDVDVQLIDGESVDISEEEVVPQNLNVSGGSGYTITKGRDKVTFSDLDENEQAVVGFIERYYNVDKNEGEEEFKKRVNEYYDPGGKMCAKGHELVREEFDCFLYAAGDIEYLPEFGPRTLKDVHLLPEYYTRDGSDYHVLITLITYHSNGEDRFEEVQFSVTDYERFHNEGRKIGILDNYDWFVQEVVKKYDDIYGQFPSTDRDEY